ncbi:hypothetical protein D3C85_1547590 [compost metagenome]
MMEHVSLRQCETHNRCPPLHAALDYNLLYPRLSTEYCYILLIADGVRTVCAHRDLVFLLQQDYLTTLVQEYFYQLFQYHQ